MAGRAETRDGVRDLGDLGHDAERPAEEVQIEARRDDLPTAVAQVLEHTYDLLVEELQLVDPDHLGPPDESRNRLQADGGSRGGEAAAVADEQRRGVAGVDDRLDQHDVVAPECPDGVEQPLRLAGVHRPRYQLEVPLHRVEGSFGC